MKIKTGMVELDDTNTAKFASITTHRTLKYGPPVVEEQNTTILWDFPVNTDRAIQANR